MSRPRLIPSYRKHSSGQARVTLVDSVTGKRRDVLLGKYKTKASFAEFARVIQQWEAASRRLPEERSTDLSINELIKAYRPFVEQHYRRADGTPTSEPNDIRMSLKPLREMYGLERAADFGPLKLKAVRQQMIAAGLVRSLINQRVNRIRRLFKWAVP